jgi:hypothetical protein
MKQINNRHNLIYLKKNYIFNLASYNLKKYKLSLVNKISHNIIIIIIKNYILNMGIK